MNHHGPIRMNARYAHACRLLRLRRWTTSAELARQVGAVDPRGLVYELRRLGFRVLSRYLGVRNKRKVWGYRIPSERLDTTEPRG